jgi:hypothetical protein
VRQPGPGHGRAGPGNGRARPAPLHGWRVRRRRAASLIPQ